jgi:glycine cleavage system aminomethyltransferase T
MGYISGGETAPGSSVAIEIRGKPIPAVITPLPFYKRAR